ncbi:MAG: photosystem II reaction center protein Ycf12 [Oscillatoriales cyanobacterium]|nr:MAG: photosystem II reaction center protein Ycf12 [Oscillatoriales cyanobacterium]
MDAIGGINWLLVGQLTTLALLVVAGPLIVFILAFRGGDL